MANTNWTRLTLTVGVAVLAAACSSNQATPTTPGVTTGQRQLLAADDNLSLAGPGDLPERISAADASRLLVKIDPKDIVEKGGYGLQAVRAHHGSHMNARTNQANVHINQAMHNANRRHNRNDRIFHDRDVDRDVDRVFDRTFFVNDFLFYPFNNFYYPYYNVAGSYYPYNNVYGTYGAGCDSGSYGLQGWSGYGSQAYAYTPFMYGYGGSYYPSVYGANVASYAQPTINARNAVVNVQCYSFMPANITIAVGGSVSWSNMDPVAHTATSDQGLWDAGSIAPGTTSLAVVFSTPGVFPYHCKYHPSMHGTITVR